MATVEFPDFCTVNGSNATCPIDEDVRSVPLRLTPVPGVAPGTRGRISPDIDESDNAGAFFLTNVENAFDVAATGGSASGVVGQTVQVSFGLVNRAVGTVDSRYDGVFPGIAFSVPDGTEAVGVDEFCGIPVYGPDGTIFDVQTGKPGGRFYLCGAAGFLARGDTDRFTFRLRITQATTTAGEASLSDNSRQYPAWSDDVHGNDDAPVTVTVVAGGGDGGGGGPAMAGRCRSPVSRPAPWPPQAGALLLTGLALVLLSRRRRVTVHSEYRVDAWRCRSGTERPRKRVRPAECRSRLAPTRAHPVWPGRVRCRRPAARRPLRR